MKSTEERKRSKSLPIKVLLVEDSPGEASFVVSALSEQINLFELKWVLSLQAATAELSGTHYECLLVDLPDADGLDVVDSLRATASDSGLVVLTGRNDKELGLHAIQRGADDYLLKSDLSARRLHRSINYAIESTRSRVILERSSARTAAVMAALGDGLVVFDRHGRVVSANPAAERIFGAVSDDLIGLPISGLPCNFVHREGTPVAANEMATQRTLASGEPVRGVIQGVRRGDGGLTWVEVNTEPLRTEDGMMDGVVSSIRDITERLAAGGEVCFQAALLGAVGQAVIATDPLGVILYWNQAATDMYGWSEEEALTRSVTEFVTAELIGHTAKIMEAASAGESWTGDFLMRRRDGTRFPAIVINTPMLDRRGELVASSGSPSISASA